jgi:hypothetical protein
MLGRASESTATEASYGIGTERGTMFPIDGEYLGLSYAKGRVRTAKIFAG